MNGLEGLRALVTGGASGIGRPTAELLARQGAHVAVLDLNTPTTAEPLIALTADLIDDSQVRAAVAHAAERLDGLDILVNNAGIGAMGSVEDNPDEQWHHVLDVNVLGVVRTTRAALPHLRRSRHAATVNTCSIAATAGLPQRALYSVGKGAGLSLTPAMAADHVHEGIRVTCVNPGTADTPWISRLLDAADDPEAERAALDARRPLEAPGDRRRGRRRHRVPGLARGRLGHRHVAGRRRRHGRPATAPPAMTHITPAHVWDLGAGGVPRGPEAGLRRPGPGHVGHARRHDAGTYPGHTACVPPAKAGDAGAASPARRPDAARAGQLSAGRARAGAPTAKGAP